MSLALASASCDANCIVNGTTALLMSYTTESQFDFFGHVMPLVSVSLDVNGTIAFLMS